MPNPAVFQSKPRRRATLIGAIAVLAVSAWGSYAMRPHHTAATQPPPAQSPSAAMTGPALAPLPAHPALGQALITVITVTKVTAAATADTATLDGDVLTRSSTGRITADGQHVHVTYTSAQIAMGGPADIKPGAVFEVDAVLSATTATGANLTASRLVNLTGIIDPS